MATNLEGNEKLQTFISLLSDLNHQITDVYASGRVDVLKKMNKTIQQMYEIQHSGTEDAYTAIEEDCQIIYQNFNAIITMLKSSEDATKDVVAGAATKKFLQNIFDAHIRILSAYGLI
jgi:hypothetical protein